jgi:preprotein translocase subunit YajC
MVNVAFGRANLSRKIVVSAERATQERFVLNAGGLRLNPVLASGEAITERAVSYDIYSDERDQYGQRTKLMSAVRPGTIIRLNAGIYNIVSSYGDANALARSDVTVEAGKLTEATLSHPAAKVTFKLVARAGGDAIADVQWTLANNRGETVKESVGALPSHILAPGTYTVSARNAGEVFQRQFSVQAGDVGQVEVVRR